MAQIFQPSTNTISRLTIYGGVFVLALISVTLYEVGKSAYYTEVNVARQQPIPFSHRHHSGELGIDCRYCHTSVETSSFAGLPPTATCMNCHSQIWSKSPTLDPVRASYRDDIPISWTRVNALPDFAYFDHSIHVAKGIGCTTCHGAVGDMPLTSRAHTLQMEWCLDCHRQPERYVRPKQDVFRIDYQVPSNQLELGRELVHAYKIQSLTDCATCHR